MSNSRTNSKKKTGAARNALARPPRSGAVAVLNLAEAAGYLRVPEAEIVRLVQQQDLPGRLLGAEWRFLKSAIQDWLRTPPRRGTKEAVLSVAGAWKGDPYVEEELREIYKQRGCGEVMVHGLRH